MVNLSNILHAKEASLMASVLLAAVGWGSTHIIDRVVNSPTVVYDLVVAVPGKINGRDYYKITAKIHNISLNKSFKCLNFFLRKASGTDTIFIESEKDGLKSEVIPSPPVWAGSDFHSCADIQGKLASTETAGVNFKLPTLPPNGRVDLVAYFQGTERPVLQVHSKSPILLSLPSFRTWLAKNELSVIASMVIIWTVVVIFLLSRGGPVDNKQENNGKKRKPKNQPAPQREGEADVGGGP